MLAPVVVQLYAIQCTMHSVNAEKVESVRQVAREMKLWQEKHGCKVPD